MKLNQKGEMNAKMIFTLAILVLVLGLLSGLYMLLVPTFHGVGAKTAAAMGTNLSLVYNNSQTLVSDTAAAGASFNPVLLWIGVAVVFISALGLGKMIESIFQQ
jgi:hypothetical protein